MSVRDILNKNFSGKTGWLFSGDIPDKKLNGTCSAHLGLEPDTIITMVDTTILGSGKTGIVFTGTKIYYKEFAGENEFVLDYSDIVSINIYSEEKKTVLNFKTKDANDKYINETISNIDKKDICQALNEIISLDSLDSLEETNQVLPLDQENSIVKMSYIKVLVSLALEDDSVIDSKEYAEITKLMTRLTYSQEERFEIRSSMISEGDKIEIDKLLENISNNSSEDRVRQIYISLMKDSINLLKVQEDIKTYQKGDFKRAERYSSLQKKLKISDEELELIENSIIADEAMFNDRNCTDDKLKSLFTNLAGQAAAVGLPLAAVYLTGTVGLSAAGITSGLAALGVGGLLGFSSMVTGIGIAVLIGVASYKLVTKGIKAITGDDSEKYKQREFLLQNVIKKSQKVINYLVEDINYITTRIAELLIESNETEEKINKLSKLVTVLKKLSEASDIVVKERNYANKEEIIIKLPKILDSERVADLTNEATKKQFYDLILNFYMEKEVKDENGKSKKELVLNDIDYAAEELEDLTQYFNAIGYFDAKTIAQTTAKKGLEVTKKGFSDLIIKAKENM